jgi:hypothetical protein
MDSNDVVVLPHCMRDLGTSCIKSCIVAFLHQLGHAWQLVALQGVVVGVSGGVLYAPKCSLGSYVFVCKAFRPMLRTRSV